VKRVSHLYFHLQILKIPVDELKNAKTTLEKSAKKIRFGRSRADGHAFRCAARG